MPIYEYECRSCRHRMETMQRISDPPLTECPECGGELRKLISAPAFHLKGSGWYVTDYAKGGGNGKPSDDAQAAGSKGGGDEGGGKERSKERSKESGGGKEGGKESSKESSAAPAASGGSSSAASSAGPAKAKD